MPKPLRWFAALGLAPIPGPFDEALWIDLLLARLFVFVVGLSLSRWG